MKEFGSMLVILGVVIPWIVKLKLSLSKIKKDKIQLQKKYESSSLKIDLKTLNKINQKVGQIIGSSVVDRFLLLSAVNGKTDFNHVSALIEQHSLENPCVLSFGATAKYIDLEADGVYKKMLKSIEVNEPYYSLVANMEPGMLREIYEGEAVTASMILFVGRYKIDENNDKLLFCSWASHEDTDYSSNLKMILTGATKAISDLLDEELSFVKKRE